MAKILNDQEKQELQTSSSWWKTILKWGGVLFSFSIPFLGPLWRMLSANFGVLGAKGLIGLVLAGSVGLFGAWNESKNKTIDVLRDNYDTQKISAQALTAEKKVLKQELEDNIQFRDYIFEQYKIGETQIKKLEDKFSKNKKGEARNIGELAVKHPKLIENAVNKGTQEAFDCIEAITRGSYEDICNSNSD